VNVDLLTVTSTDGTLIGVQRSGTGPPLVLVHGAVADRSRWAPVLPALEQRATVYALDRRGRGASGDTEPYAIQREFEDVAAVIASIGGPVDVLGHSFGAFCALEAARLTPNLRALILYEPPPPGVPGGLPPGAVTAMQNLLQAGDRAGAVSTFLLHVARLPPHELELLRSAPSWPGRVAAAHTILREIHALEALPILAPERYQALTAPTLLLLGGDSPPLYADTITALHGLLPNSRIAVLPGQQHVAMNTAPELFLREVIGFLAEPA